MNKIASFQVNHLDLLPGLYLSRQDRQDQCTVSTFDLRVTAPNREPVMDTPAIHTIEHLGATFLRNSSRKEEIIYFGPMGCRTGFYLVVFGDQTAEDVCPLVLPAAAAAPSETNELEGNVFIGIRTPFSGGSCTG